MTDKKNITGFSPKDLFLGEQRVFLGEERTFPHRGRIPWSVRNCRDNSSDDKHLINNRLHFQSFIYRILIT